MHTHYSSSSRSLTHKIARPSTLNLSELRSLDALKPLSQIFIQPRQGQQKKDYCSGPTA